MGAVVMEIPSAGISLGTSDGALNVKVLPGPQHPTKPPPRQLSNRAPSQFRSVSPTYPAALEDARYGRYDLRFVHSQWIFYPSRVHG